MNTRKSLSGGIYGEREKEKILRTIEKSQKSNCSRLDKIQISNFGKKSDSKIIPKRKLKVDQSLKIENGQKCSKNLKIGPISNSEFFGKNVGQSGTAISIPMSHPDSFSKSAGQNTSPQIRRSIRPRKKISDKNFDYSLE